MDIQAIACQIAKLRFFISLAIEQDYDPDNEDNFGIRPLPNLETRFVAADALLGFERAHGLGSDSESVRGLKRSLQINREQHFHANTRPDKLACMKEDRRLRAELVGELRDLPENTAEKVASWDPYDQNAVANWFDPTWMFGIESGFDVVLGNPPYVQLQKNGGRLRKLYENRGYETLVPRGDLYQLFLERGCQLLRPESGILTYITSNSWLRAKYGETTRRWLSSRHRPLRLLDMGKDVFDAVVDACVLVLPAGGVEAGASAPPFPAADTDQLSAEPFPPPEEKWRSVRPQSDRPWSILTEVEWSVMEKMRAEARPLRNWDLKISYGVKTGLNEAFIIDTATRDALVAEDPASTEILKPILRGKDVRRWRGQWAGLWLIVAEFGSHEFLEDRYPAVYRHLAAYEKKLKARGQCTNPPSGRRQGQAYDGQHHWLELNNNPSDDFIRSFAAPKLMWMDMSPHGRFAYSDREVYCGDTVYVMPGASQSLKSMCSVLNSSLVNWYVHATARTTGMGLIRWQKFVVETIPIPRIPDDLQETLVHVADHILAIKGDDPDGDVSAEEARIDRLVYDLYGLTADERAAIEESTGA